jgi:hypothetical protein
VEAGAEIVCGTAERLVHRILVRPGIRNGEAFAFDAEGRLFVTQHGRDQLFQNWPHLYTAEQSAALPAEELLQLTSADSWIGWHFPEADWRVRPLLSASRITASFAAISENTGMPRFVSLRGFRAKPHFPSKQVTNDQDCFGRVRYPRDRNRSTIVELIEVSHRQAVGFRAP